MSEPHDAHEPANKRLEYLKLWVDRRIVRSHALRAAAAKAVLRSSELRLEWEQWRADRE